MLWLYRFIIGFLEVEFSGDIAEVILNICAKNGISLWNSRRKGQKIRGYITVRDFKTLPNKAKKSGLRVHILKKRGLPFIINRYKNRFGIPVGAALFFSFLYIMSCFIWSIQVDGNKGTSESVILEACEKIGIKEGTLKSKIKPQIAKQELLLEVKNLAWASVNIEGSKATVNITEAKDKGEDKSTPTNLIASADGKITKIDITSGNCVVKAGDTVAKGELLVSGVIERANSTSFVHSAGMITAETEREIEVKACYTRTVSRKTGVTKKRSVLYFFGIKIPLYLGGVNGSYEFRYDIKEICLLGEKLPIRLYTKYYEMTEEKEITITKDELLKELEELLKETANKEKIYDFEVKNRKFEEFDGGISLKAVISAEENIAKPEILLFNTGN